MHSTAEKFRSKVSEELDIEIEIKEFPEGTKTAEDAAEAIGCEVDQIVKSIVMNAGDGLVLVLTSGSNRVRETGLAREQGLDESQVDSADPSEVKEVTGWSIGGVPPFCHESDIPVFIDEKLMEFDRVWAAAGTPEAVFGLEPEKIKSLSGAEKADIFE